MTSRPAPQSRLPGRTRSLRFPLILASLLALGACSSQDAPPPASAPATQAAAPSADGATAGGAAAPIAPATPREPGPIVAPAGPAPVAGTDYVEIPGGQPFAPGTGKIEVVEVFGYTCPACARFEPLFSSWKARAPADVQVVPVAAPFGGHWQPYAQAYYAADTLGLAERTHDAMFRAVHIDRSLPPTGASNEQIAAFYGQQGVDANEFASTMSSFAVDAKMKRANQFLSRSGVDSTPTLVVNGKYRVTGSSFEEHLRIADHLVARERAAAGNTATAASAPPPATGG